MEIDPTLNENLHVYIWNKLLKKIKIESARTKKSNEATSAEESDKIQGMLSTPKENLNNPDNKSDRKPANTYNPLPSSSKEKLNTSTSEKAPMKPVRIHGKDMRRLIKLVVRAILNPKKIPWDMEEYYDEYIKRGRDQKRARFPNPSFGKFSEPLTVVDSKGHIVLWYLPGLLSKGQLMSMKSATIQIEPLLKKSVKKEIPNKTTPNWRSHELNFAPKTSDHVMEPGAANFSAGWYAQGHTKDDDPFLPSLNLRSEYPLETRNWLSISRDVERFMNLTLSLIHPDLYKMGLEILTSLREYRPTSDVATLWQSVCTGISVICNRGTPLHRDTKGRPEWYDILLNYHETGPIPRLFLEDIGLDLEYSSGTVVGFCGSILKHGVELPGVQNRICYAHFMRESVRARFKIERAGWVYRESYLPDDIDITDEDDDMEVDK